jgi:hypothetical protein
VLKLRIALALWPLLVGCGAGNGGIAAGEDAGGSPIDAPPSSCTPAVGCGTGVCWLHPSGAYACVPAPAEGDIPRDPCSTNRLCCTMNAQCTDRPGGRCVSSSYQFCGGAPPPPGNRCLYDDCSADGDCRERSHGTCLPLGLGYVFRTCAYGSCRTSADCTRAAGGECTIYWAGCGAGGQLYCRYPNDVCRKAADCPKKPSDPYGQLCVPATSGHGTQCVPQPPPVP